MLMCCKACFKQHRGVLAILCIAVFGLAVGLTPHTRAYQTSQIIRPRIYLPIILRVTPPPPPVTQSLYVTDRNIRFMAGYGCNQAQMMKPKQHGVSVLFFGQPWYENQHYGTIILGDSDTFTNTTSIAESVKSWLFGFNRCSIYKDSKITLAIATNNLGSHTDRGHGQAWAKMVSDIATYTKTQTYSQNVEIRGASDMELRWNTPSKTRLWVEGYSSVYQQPFYNLGDCSGCPSYKYPGRVPDNGWTKEDIWYISWGNTAARVLPQIYAEDGQSAPQWQIVAKWAADSGKGRMLFLGAITQYQACLDKNNPCAGVKNTPQKGWSQLWGQLNRDLQTAQEPVWVTDVTWGGPASLGGQP